MALASSQPPPSGRNGPRRRNRRARRRAAAMAGALVCLLVIMLLGSTLVRGMLLHQRQTKAEVRQLQALWLAEAAAALAVEQLRADADYLGQTWRTAVTEGAVATDDSTDTAAVEGVAEIAVQPVAGQPNQRMLRIRATYPDDPVRRAVLKLEITVTLSALGASQ